MIVRIARVKVGNRQAPYATTPTPPLKRRGRGVYGVRTLPLCTGDRQRGWCDAPLPHPSSLSSSWERLTAPHASSARTVAHAPVATLDPIPPSWQSRLARRALNLARAHSYRAPLTQLQNSPLSQKPLRQSNPISCSYRQQLIV